MPRHTAGWLCLLLLAGAGACGGAAATGAGAHEWTAKPEGVAAPVSTPDKATANVEPTPDPANPADAPPAAAQAEAKEAPVFPAVSQEIAESPGAPELEAGARAIQREDWVNGRKVLGIGLKKIEGTATVDALMAGHALLGRACVALEDEKCAEREFAAVTALFQAEGGALKKLEALGGDDAEKHRRLARALLAEGEVRFFAAEKRRKEVEKLPAPMYKGNGSRESVTQHVSAKVAPWIKQKRALIEAAEKAYANVVDLKPASPPRWVIAASARVGMMWGRFVAELRATPIPAEWKKSGPVPSAPGMTYDELRAAYYEQIDIASEPQRAVARAAFEKCRSLSVKYRYEDQLSRGCDTWLAKHGFIPGATP
jgi:hypothetical protein